MSEYIIQEVDTFDLVAALGPDFSCDGWYGNMEQEDPGEMLTGKLDDCWYYGHEYLIDVMVEGCQEAPIVVGTKGWEKYGTGVEDWAIGNGNHRLAIAIAAMVPTILVVFTEDRDDFMVSHISEKARY